MFQQNGGSAVDAVEAAVRVLEDNEIFNAGRGSLLNHEGEVECDAMIMEGHTLNNGSITRIIYKLVTFAPPPPTHTNESCLHFSPMQIRHIDLTKSMKLQNINKKLRLSFTVEKFCSVIFFAA